MSLPNDYTEHVYTVALGKFIGVYLGHPLRGLDLYIVIC